MGSKRPSGIGRSASIVVLVMAFGACGGSTRKADPLALPGEASTPCTQALVQGHDREAAGEPTPAAFLASLRDCPSLAEWTAAANALGIKLGGREPQFVDNTCSAATADAVVKASRICREAAVAVNDPRRIP